MTPLTNREKQLIAKNIIAACKDINKLNKRGYDFINVANGFIAHYDINGFKAYYSEHSLQDDIEQNARSNQWGNFRKGEGYYDYYMAKRDCYNMILGAFSAQQFIREHVQFIHVG